MGDQLFSPSCGGLFKLACLRGLHNLCTVGVVGFCAFLEQKSVNTYVFAQACALLIRGSFQLEIMLGSVTMLNSIPWAKFRSVRTALFLSAVICVQAVMITRGLPLTFMPSRFELLNKSGWLVMFL